MAEAAMATTLLHLRLRADLFVIPRKISMLMLLVFLQKLTYGKSKIVGAGAANKDTDWWVNRGSAPATVFFLSVVVHRFAVSFMCVGTGYVPLAAGASTTLEKQCCGLCKDVGYFCLEENDRQINDCFVC